jgi:hypothetical protein
MRREDVLELIQKLPKHDHSKIMLVLTSGIGITIDVLFKIEPEYLVIRGREAGTSDENRAFFLPYGEIAYLKLERPVKLTELQKWYGLPVDATLDGVPAENGPAAAPEPAPSDAGPPAPTPAPAVDPAIIARQNLLERIRAARTSAGMGAGPRRAGK